MNENGYDRLAKSVNYAANKYKHSGNAPITARKAPARKAVVRGSNQTLEAKQYKTVYKQRPKDVFKRVAKAGNKGIA